MNTAQGLRQAMGELIAASGPRAHKNDYNIGLRTGQARVITYALGYDKYPCQVHEAALDAVLRYCEIESELDALYVGVMLDRQWINMRAYVKGATNTMRQAIAAQR